MTQSSYIHPYIPPGIDPDEWSRLPVFGRMLVEAGMYHGTDELLPQQLYVEHLISKVNLKDIRQPGFPHDKAVLPRMELKMFLQFLRIAGRSSEYARRVCAVAETKGMSLSLDEDGASLMMEQDRRDREATIEAS